MVSKVLTLGKPTLAVFNGHAYAGGAILGFAHDKIIMTSNPKSKICLSEINVGLPFPPGYAMVCKSRLTSKAFRELHFGIEWDPQHAHKEDVVDNLYDGPEDCEN